MMHIWSNHTRVRVKKLLDRIFLPGWIIFAADMVLVSVVFMFTYLLRLNLVSSAVDIPVMMIQLGASLPFFILGAFIFKPYHGIIRHSTVRDAGAVVKSHTLGTSFLFLITLLGRWYYPVLIIPFSVIISQYFIAIVVMTGIRFTIAFIYDNLEKSPEPDQGMMIFGAGSMGQITKNVIEKENALHYKLVGFLDDNPALQHKKIDGLTVYTVEEAFAGITDQKKVKEIVIGIHGEKLSKERKRHLVDLCIARDIRVKEVPEVTSWLNGNFYANQIHDVKIEDLLGRDPIEIENSELARWIHDARIMVTGAAGSIGSEIVAQLIKLYPGTMVLVDQAESALHDLLHAAVSRQPDVKLHAVVADITDGYRMRQIFGEFAPEIIFHASAYKHVPLMEEHPYEALRTNVLGTKIIADLAVEYGVKKFVMISTDKAVNPTSVMGASKRICEMYCASLSRQPGLTTRFITTRFGNVLGSSGSVIPLFRRQISMGGPVTVTDKEIIRYFMTIPEACSLVLEAGLMGEGGEIFLFEMGQPVKIYDLAEKMIRLSGFLPHQDIEIVETGLRPGEKLYEELLAIREEHLPTHHGKILIAAIKPYDFNRALQQINDLVAHLDKEPVESLVARMKAIVPEYKSRNSRFEALD